MNIRDPDKPTHMTGLLLSGLSPSGLFPRLRLACHTGACRARPAPVRPARTTMRIASWPACPAPIDKPSPVRSCHGCSQQTTCQPFPILDVPRHATGRCLCVPGPTTPRHRDARRVRRLSPTTPGVLVPATAMPATLLVTAAQPYAYLATILAAPRLHMAGPVRRRCNANPCRTSHGARRCWAGLCGAARATEQLRGRLMARRAWSRDPPRPVRFQPGDSGPATWQGYAARRTRQGNPALLPASRSAASHVAPGRATFQGGSFQGKRHDIACLSLSLRAIACRIRPSRFSASLRSRRTRKESMLSHNFISHPGASRCRMSRLGYPAAPTFTKTGEIAKGATISWQPN
jgi:hypothetical protein